MTKLNAPWLTHPAIRTLAHLFDSHQCALWFVGGAVRNTLLHEPIGDFDLATDARPERVMEIAKQHNHKCIPTGVTHGTVTLIIDRIPFEITTFRHDIKTDGRHADVTFTTSLHEDAARRDFTMNALYLSAKGELQDPLGGLKDLKARAVRFIGDPHQRIQEDYLRILRFFRFYATYGTHSQHAIDPDGLAACAAHLDGLDTLSQERITSEMVKLLSAHNPAPAIASLAACGALMRILGTNTHSALAPLIHIEHELKVCADWRRRLSCLTQNLSDAKLKISKKDQAYLTHLASDLPLHALAYRANAQTAKDAYLVQSASLSTLPDVQTLTAIDNSAQQRFPITSADLMPRYQGAALGQTLHALERKWLDSHFTLTRSELLGTL